MKHFFHKSAGLIIFTVSVSFILSFCAALARGIKQANPMEINDVGLIITIAAVLVLLLLLNTVDIVEFWLRGRLRELTVKRIVGIDASSSLFSLFLNLNALIFLSAVLGGALTLAATLLFSFAITLRASAAEFLLSLLVCALIINPFCALLIVRKFSGLKAETH